MQNRNYSSWRNTNKVVIIKRGILIDWKEGMVYA